MVRAINQGLQLAGTEIQAIFVVFVLS